MSEGHELVDVPPEVILERILPVLPDRALLALSATSKRFHELCNDESLWLHRTRLTFTYNPHTLAPPNAGSGWSKRLYIGLSRPEVYVWGCGDNDRLGLPERRTASGGRIVSYNRRVTAPACLEGQFGRGAPEGRSWINKLGDDLRASIGASRVEEVHEGGKSDIGIVEIQAGGWSFAARDMAGRVWVWGQLDGELPNWRSAGWDNKNERVPEPTPIPLPCRAEAISVGRSHMLILDEDNLVWEMTAWGRVYHHTATALTSPTNPGSTRRPHHIVQLSTGWTHSACLTSGGRIYAWFPFTQAYADALTRPDELNGPLGVREGGNESRAVKWGTVSGDVVQELEPLPPRPGASDEADLEDEWEAAQSSLSLKAREAAEKVVKIASGHEFIVALKANGEVWLLAINQNRQSQWEYLPHFSSPRISHITAQFTSLTSYSTSSPSAVHHGRLPEQGHPGFGKTFRPDDLPSLQGKGVIQVAIGDYHFLALTSRGEVYAWGQGDAGQLGLGEMGTRGQRVAEPQRVHFQKAQATAGGEEPFVFAITASGWHTGALVLGEPKRRESTKGKEKQAAATPLDPASRVEPQPDLAHSTVPSMPGAFPSIHPPTLGFAPDRSLHQGGPRPGGSLPFFRIGLAGAQQRSMDLEQPEVEPPPQIQGLDMLATPSTGPSSSNLSEPVGGTSGPSAGVAREESPATNTGGSGETAIGDGNGDGNINLIARQTQAPLLNHDTAPQEGPSESRRGPLATVDPDRPWIRTNFGGRSVGRIDPIPRESSDM